MERHGNFVSREVTKQIGPCGRRKSEKVIVGVGMGLLLEGHAFHHIPEF